MRFHLPSYLLGVVSGAAGTAVVDRLRPVAVAVATGFYRVGDALMLRLACAREDLSDLFAEARARARTVKRAHLHIVREDA